MRHNPWNNYKGVFEKNDPFVERDRKNIFIFIICKNILYYLKILLIFFIYIDVLIIINNKGNPHYYTFSKEIETNKISYDP